MKVQILAVKMLFRHLADLLFENKVRVDEINLSERIKFVRVIVLARSLS